MNSTELYDNYEAKAEVPGYRVNDPSTSKEAFEQVCVPQREQDVLNALASLMGEGTCEEITEVCSVVYARTEIPSNFSPRIAQLLRKELVEDTKCKRKSAQGKMQRVVRLTRKGWERASAFSDPRSGQ